MNTGLGRELEEREGVGLEPGRLTRHSEAGAGLAAEADPVEGQAAEVAEQIGHGVDGQPLGHGLRCGFPLRAVGGLCLLDRGVALGWRVLRIVVLEEDAAQVPLAQVPLRIV